MTVLINGADRIENIRIEGDFFGEGDIRELEKGLLDCSLCEDGLKERLDCLTSHRYISGVTARELSGLILTAI